MSSNTYSTLEKKIGITFRDKRILENAFVHRSYLNEHKEFDLPSNEKMEFLGDSVLSLISSVYLFKNYPAYKEGDYTEIKAAVVKTSSLAEAAEDLNLGVYLNISKGEELSGGRHNTNILADCFEALIAAIFLDQGFDVAYTFVLNHLFGDKLRLIIEKELYRSSKSKLQELFQAKYKRTPQYTILKEEGPEHDRTFTIAVSLENDPPLAQGVGRSKKEAEEAAATKALLTLVTRP